MAYAALASLDRAIDQVMSHDQDYAFLCSKDQIKSLQEKTISIQYILENISGLSRSSMVDVLESRITCLAYRLEDIIESALCISLDQDFESEIDKQDFYRCFEEVNVLLLDAMEMEKNLENKDRTKAHSPSIARTSQIDSTKDIVVGLDLDMVRILDQITGQGSNLKVVPITGMGGIGKTTLARAIYDDPLTRNYFHLRVWVTVSGEFRMEDIFRGLLPVKQQNEVPDKRLFDCVYQNLIGLRFLIVLDDIWQKEVWDGVRRAFPDDNNGSRVIVTTRLLEVANYTRTRVDDSKDVHEMQLLDEDQSWILLKNEVFGHDICSTEYEGMGRMISRNCRGLPLALVVISGLLKFNMCIDYWTDIARDTNRKAASDSNHFFEILSLSYTNLPSHLKACFLYMGAFKEDYEIPTNEISMIWTAEGFLRKPKESMKMEEVAKECLEELIKRSLVMVTKRGYNMEIRTLRVHDVLREVSLRKAQEEKFLHYFTAEHMNETSFREILSVQRRVSFSTHKLFEFPCDSYDSPARSFLNKYPMSSRRLSIIHRFKLLRVLYKVLIEDVSNLNILFRLTNLRYLHLVRKETSPPLEVPQSISNLQNLETLVFSGRLHAYRDQYEVVLPLEIWKIPRLRHLVLTRKSYLPFPVLDQDYSVIESVQTLSWVTNFDVSTRVIEKIRNIKKLRVEYRVITKNDRKHFHLDNLVHLHQLEELSVWGETWGPEIRNYAFPRNLKNLTLERTKIPWEKMSIVGSLPYLEKLKLKWLSVTGKEWEPNNGEFLQLKYLKMDDLVIHEWKAECTHFPCLETLIIVSCEQLNGVPTGIGEIDTLTRLVVKDCKYITDSLKEIQEDKQNNGDADLQINVSDDEDFLPDIF